MNKLYWANFEVTKTLVLNSHNATEEKIKTYKIIKKHPIIIWNDFFKIRMFKCFCLEKIAIKFKLSNNSS